MAIHLRIGVSQKWALPDLSVYHYVAFAVTCFLEVAMHTAVIRSAQSLGIVTDWMPSPWRSRLRSILSSRRHRKNGEKDDSLYRLNDRLPADLGLYREHRIDGPQNRSVHQGGSPVPVALLAMWAPI
jgi:hypothetical protein